ncbi:MAG: S1 family peptidase [Candidatus Hodarchaeales archaeon]
MHVIDPSVLKTTVMIARVDSVKDRFLWKDIRKRCIGTGFLVGYQKLGFLVTSRHVVTKYPEGNPNSPRSNLVLACGSKTAGNIPIVVSLEENQEINRTHWNFPENPDIDLAVLFIGLDKNVVDVKYVPVRDSGSSELIQLGQDVFFTGYPLGLTPGSIVSPVVRKGSIALNMDDGTHFLIDAVSKVGNSGSPVFSGIRIVDIMDTKFTQGPYLLGVIKYHIENTGSSVNLAGAVRIEKLVELLEESHKAIIESRQV